MLITIGGPPGSGKTTAAQLLAERLGIPTTSVGGIFREMAKEREMSLADFGKLAARDHAIDIELDRRMVARAKQGNIILDGRLAGHMAAQHGLDAFKIWVTATPRARAMRVSGREDKTTDQVVREIEEREQGEIQRYLDIYDIDLRDMSIYDLVLDNSDLGKRETVDAIMAALRNAGWLDK